MSKYTLKDMDKATSYLRKECASEFIKMEIDHQGILLISAVNISGEAVTISIYPESVATFAKITKSERL